MSPRRWSATSRADLLRRMDQWVDPLLIFLASVSVPLLIIQTGDPSPGDISLITATSWIIWGAFATNFVVRLSISTDRRSELRNLAWDLFLIVGQALYTLGARQADALLAFLRLAVIVIRTVRRGRVIRRTGHKLRSHPLRVVAFIAPFLWMTSAALVHRFETENGVVGSVGDALWWSAVTMATVGYGDIAPKTPPGRFVAVGTMVVGIGLFSLITARFAELLFVYRTRSGASEVLERDHTLIVGWSPKLRTIIGELAIARRDDPRAAVVVLADRDPAEMHDDLVAHVPQLVHSGLVVLTRRGRTSDPADLTRCHPESARAVIVIDDTEEDAGVVRALLALTQLLGDDTTVPVIAEVDDPGTATAVRIAFGGAVIVVNPAAFIARTAAQACRSTSIALAYEDLLDFEGAEIHVVPVPGVAGRRYGELIGGFRDSCVIGHRPAGGRARLNPPFETMIGPDDQLIVVADDERAITFTAAAPVTGRAAARVGGDRPEHIVVFGWNEMCPVMLAELDAYVAPGSVFTIVVDPRRTGRPDPDDHRPGPLDNAEVTIRTASAIEYAELVGIMAEQPADHAIVLCYRHETSAAEADAQALMTTLQIRRVVQELGSPTTVVTELRDPRDAALAPLRVGADFIIGDRLVSLFLAQLAQTPALDEVFEDLFDPAGAELWCRPYAAYGLGADPRTFADLVLAAAERGESAIGYRRADLPPDDPRGGTRLNPPRSELLALAADDHVFVIADQAT